MPWMALAVLDAWVAVLAISTAICNTNLRCPVTTPLNATHVGFVAPLCLAAICFKAWLLA